MLGRIKGKRKKGRQKVRWTDDVKEATDLCIQKHFYFSIY